LAKLRFYDENGEANFDHDNSQDSKIFMVKMVNQNLIMTITTIPDIFVPEIVEISVNFDHLMIKMVCGHGRNGHFDHDHLENPKVSWSWSDVCRPPTPILGNG
jgi:hypothetical protein